MPFLTRPSPDADRVFLDANILFSAAYREDSGLSRLGELTGTELFTSAYAAEEARRNLDSDAQRERLEMLLTRVTVLSVEPLRELPPDVSLPDKDRPILRSAIASRCSHLLTGDRKHFGPFFGLTVSGVLITRAADYLEARE